MGWRERNGSGGDKRRRDNLNTGFLVMTLGVLFWIDQMHWGAGWRFRDLWPVLLIVMGLCSCLIPSKRGLWNTSGLFSIAFGVFFLLQRQHIVREDLLASLAIVGLGLVLMFGSSRRRERERERRGVENGAGHE